MLKQSVVTESPPNADGNQGTKPSKKIKGNGGANKGDTTLRADRGGATKGKGKVCTPHSPARNNLLTNKHQQRVDPVASLQRLANRKVSRDSTKITTACFLRSGAC